MNGETVGNPVTDRAQENAVESVRVLGLLIKSVWPDNRELGKPVGHPGLRSCQLAHARLDRFVKEHSSVTDRAQEIQERGERIRKHMSPDRRGTGDCPERAGVCYCAQNAAHDALDELERELEQLREALARIERRTADFRISIAAWCPHGFDSARTWDYNFAADFTRQVEDIKEIARAALAGRNPGETT